MDDIGKKVADVKANAEKAKTDLGKKTADA